MGGSGEPRDGHGSPEGPRRRGERAFLPARSERPSLSLQIYRRLPLSKYTSTKATPSGVRRRTEQPPVSTGCGGAPAERERRGRAGSGAGNRNGAGSGAGNGAGAGPGRPGCLGGGSAAPLNASRSSECWQGAGSASECSPAEPMSWDRMRYILWDNNCSVPPQIHMTPFTAAFAERSPYLLRKEKEREGESERAEKRRAPTAQISNLPPPPPPPPNTQQQPPPQIRCAPKTPPRLQTTELPATHTLAEGARKLREGERGEEPAASSLSAQRLHCTSCFFWRSSVEESSGI